MIQVEVIGNLGADAEVAEINGQYYARFNVGVNRQSGNGDKVTTWVNCSKAVTPSGNLTQYLQKGQPV